MRPGAMDRRIDIFSENKADDQDDLGGDFETHTLLVASLPAQVLRFRGGERFESEQFNATTIKIFKIRWRTDVKTRDQIHYKRQSGITEIYDILEINELGRCDGLEIMAEAQVNTGQTDL